MEGNRVLDDRVECPKCAEHIKARAKLCRFCGFDIEHERMPVRSTGRGREDTSRGRFPVRVEKSPGVAAALAFLYPGLGHIYCGAIGIGLAIMFAPALVFLVLIFALYSAAPVAQSATGVAGLWVVLAIGILVFQIWQVFDAYRLAERFNRTPGRDVSRVFGGRSRSGRRRGRTSRRRTRRPRR